MRTISFLVIAALLCGCLSGPGTDTTTTMPYEQAREIVGDAISQKDVKVCDQIQDQVKRDWCYWTVGLAGGSINTCTQIEHTVYRAGCYMAIAISTNNPSTCSRIEFEDSDKIFATRNRCSSIVGGKISACDELANGVQKDMCYLTVGAAKKDASMCGKIANKDSQELCNAEVAA